MIVDLWVKENVNDVFNVVMKQEIIALLNYKVFFEGKWLRLTDTIEDIVDSYIGYLEERNQDIITIDLSKGMKDD